MSAPFFVLEADTLGALRATGAVSFANAKQALAQMPPPACGSEMKVDLGALDGADSATLAVLIAWSAAARRAGASLHFSRAPQGLRNLAILCEVDGLLGLA
ncbi:MAG: STAS domain-containing protein [Xanthomonadaceae bacterium]|nr:STAS domain-containing protein [Xanthomonadaceae bacterium]MDE1884517.1 STAS domain-containing protein [Xanthomonadaceae bacterium]MDE1960962.1 STAS domain-containing protein [Xanthomonadaceae bacterium]MDE2084419.1 STAS domain-containing protein [Xanthomonadaceae bacterium]MDE2258391.1 STAS domain-containing protein [Xanthomonadaceae bacterium]